MSRGDMVKPLLGHGSTEGDRRIMPASGRTIGVLGSGDFARSLAIRLVCSGFKVVVGSRNPKRKANLFPSAAEVTFQAEAVKKTDIIFVAVFREHYSTLCDLADVLAGKILVDVSNNTEINHHKESNAEYLASLFPACTVVKGFNVVSAWTLQSGARDGNKQVIHPFIKEQKNKFYKIPIEVVNTTLPCVSYVMLSLVYLLGVLAACSQLYYGTKYRRFPDWLDQWLQHRKQIGLLSFFCAALHAVYSLCLPMRRSHRYLLIETAVKQAMEKKMNIWVEEEVWRMEIYISVGIIALGLLSLLAITSLPSIANSLNWREFSFIQSSLGFIALVVSTLHTLTYGWSRAFDENQYKFYLPPTYTLTLLVPCTVIIAKVIFSLPCIRHRLLRIRRGWEKGRYVKFVLPSATGEYSSGETSSNV
ncbi:metalloreductase STEAP3 isoform X2 [Pithys albifrons albifrons]|uniref:metalloreductase STEAP3 isoform X2 n=1 Tax=Pithys albifrons albifrons TaxID=3385563 RepID=UPI003A5CAED0